MPSILYIMNYTPLERVTTGVSNELLFYDDGSEGRGKIGNDRKTFIKTTRKMGLSHGKTLEKLLEGPSSADAHWLCDSTYSLPSPHARPCDTRIIARLEPLHARPWRGSTECCTLHLIFGDGTLVSPPCSSVNCCINSNPDHASLYSCSSWLPYLPYLSKYIMSLVYLSLCGTTPEYTLGKTGVESLALALAQARLRIRRTEGFLLCRW